jgi:hypothetical protein
MLIDDIILLLSNEQSSLTEALLKTKVLLHQLGKKELTGWINNELNGYPEEDDVPKYRILSAHVRGNMSNAVARYSKHQIPIAHLKEDECQSLQTVYMRESLSVLAEFGKGDGQLRKPIAMELNGYLSEGLGNGFHVELAWSEVSKIHVGGILVQVRSRLLDFLLDLKDSLGGATSESEIKEKSSALDMTSMFNNAIFGPNTTIVVGDNNVQRIESYIIQGDFDSLRRQLKHLGIDDAAIDELNQIESHEKSEPDKKTLKERVTGWLKEQAGKQLDVQGQAAIALSVDAVTHALRAYFGF